MARISLCMRHNHQLNVYVANLDLLENKLSTLTFKLGTYMKNTQDDGDVLQNI